MSNKAAFVTEAKAHPLKVADATLPKAGPGEVIVKNHAFAVNPVDWKIQDYGIFIQKYPIVLGTDVSGEVYEVGEGVTHVKKGDRVLAHVFSLVTNNPEDGGFQLYSRANGIVTQKIPSSLSYEQAAVLPLSISTAASTLFKKEALALPFPSISPQQTGKSVLVWGGSSSVGASAIQLAAAAGVTVVTVASKHNLEKVKALGAKHAFDYNSPSVADDIIKALEGTEYLGVSDAVGTPESFKAWEPVYKKLGGKFGSVLPDPQGLPEGIQGTSVFAPLVGLSDRYIGEAVWANYIPEALEKGLFQAKPDPIVIKGGLEKVQEGFDVQKKGVSFAKVVVTV